MHPAGYNFLGPNTEYYARMKGSDFYKNMMINAGRTPVGTEPYDKPINELDKCAMDHDAVFSRNNNTPQTIRNADIRFRNCASEIKDANLKYYIQIQLARAAILTKQYGEDAGLISPNMFANIKSPSESTAEFLNRVRQQPAQYTLSEQPKPTDEPKDVDEDTYRKFARRLRISWGYAGVNERDLETFFATLFEGEYGMDGTPIYDYASQIRAYAQKAKPTYRLMLIQLVRMLVANDKGFPQVDQALLNNLERVIPTGTTTERQKQIEKDAVDMQRALSKTEDIVVDSIRIQGNMTNFNRNTTQFLTNVTKIEEKPDVAEIPEEGGITQEAATENQNKKEVRENALTFIYSIIFGDVDLYNKILEGLAEIYSIVKSSLAIVAGENILRFIFRLINYFRGNFLRFVPTQNARGGLRKIVDITLSGLRMGGLTNMLLSEVIRDELQAYFGRSMWLGGYTGLLGLASTKFFRSFALSLFDRLPRFLDIFKSDMERQRLATLDASEAEFRAMQAQEAEERLMNNFQRFDLLRNYLQDNEAQALIEEFNEVFLRLQQGREVQPVEGQQQVFIGEFNNQKFGEEYFLPLRAAIMTREPREKLINFLRFFNKVSLGFNVYQTGSEPKRYASLQATIDDLINRKIIPNAGDLATRSWRKIKVIFLKDLDLRYDRGYYDDFNTNIFDLLTHFNDGSQIRGYSLQAGSYERTGKAGKPFERLVEQLFTS
jgi:hypothetical protein